MHPRSALIGLSLVTSITLGGCQPQSGDTPPSETSDGAGPVIAEITAGTERDEYGEIADKRTSFRNYELTLAFNVVMEGLTEPMDVTAFWILEDDTGNFANIRRAATPEQPVVQFDLEKDTRWPRSTYTMYVEAGTGSAMKTKLFQYEVR